MLNRHIIEYSPTILLMECFCHRRLDTAYRGLCDNRTATWTAESNVSLRAYASASDEQTHIL